ncbi:DUF58 domain-containing protein [Arthrobacter glacialis]|uniref:DUF58 domain-containing protein n=1 Tax=Arthrobacter glacialis TaxID=1664 RepID=UPI000CD3E2FA|nr:DUF58 domain-containing protein [Arthrobacter glacialis]POH60708.1 DUF58 domain-containing protein [Arthrobacter glacialis]
MFALRPLRPRGWLLVIFGVLALLLAAYFGRRDLLMVAVFCFLLPVAACLGIYALRPGVSVQRHISPSLSQVGLAVNVTLEVRGSNPGGSRIRLVETLPPGFNGARPFSFPQPVVPHGRLSRYHYELHPRHRGVFTLGPLKGHFTDPFDVAFAQRALDAGDLLTVAPAAVELPAISLGDSRGNDGSQASRSPAHASHDDAMAREYRHGDPLRRVHWPVTARAGKLMVRAEESVTTPEAALILDQRPGAFGPELAANPGEADSSGSLRTTALFETAVVAAVSVASHLLERGYTLRILDQLGQPAFSSSPSAANPEQEDFAGPTAALEVSAALAAVELAGVHTVTVPHREPFAESLAHKLQQSRRRGPLVAITGTLSAQEALLLAGTSEQSAGAYALVLCHDTADAGEALEILRRAGWQAAALTRHSPVEDAWAQLESETLHLGGGR